MHGSRKHREPDEVHVKKAANGGYIVRESFDNSTSGESYSPPREHAFSDRKAAGGHVMKWMGQKPTAISTPPTKAQGRAVVRKRGAGVD